MMMSVAIQPAIPERKLSCDTTSMRIRSRAGVIALGIAVAALAIVVIVSGIALLVAMAIIAVLVAGAAILVRKIFGRPIPPTTVRRAGTLGFDPALEVFPPESPTAQPRLDSPARATSGEQQGGT